MLKEFKDIIETQDQEKQEKLIALYSIIKEVVPNATEKISWGMPTFFEKKNIVHFFPNKNHIGFYPGPAAIEHFQQELITYKTSKGAIQLSYSKDFDKELIQAITLFSLEENLK